MNNKLLSCVSLDYVFKIVARVVTDHFSFCLVAETLPQ